MKEIQVLVTVQIDSDDDIETKHVESAVTVIRNAVKWWEDGGFDHPCSFDVSLGIADVELFVPPDPTVPVTAANRIDTVNM